MPIWDHAGASTEPLESELEAKSCPHCRGELAELPKLVVEYADRPERCMNELEACLTCGWWRLYRLVHHRFSLTQGVAGMYGTTAILRRFAAEDLSEPLGDVRAFLLAKWERRQEVNPHVFQDVVASVFRDRGWVVVATAHQNDGGIDIVLEREGQQCGVQVKRTKNAIQASQLREFVGALVVGGFTKGIYVTASTFTAGSRLTAARARSSTASVCVELLNADAFLRDLGIAQRAAWRPDLDELMMAMGSKCHYLGSVDERPFPVDARVLTIPVRQRKRP